MVVLIAVGGAGWGAAPAQAEGGVRLRATPGWAGRCRSGGPVLVRALLSADRLVSGVLSAESTSGPSSAVTEVPVEVAGGTEEEVVLVVQSPFGCGGLRLRLQEKTGTTTTEVGVPDAGDTVLVGLLPGARRGTPPASAVARTGVAAVDVLEPDLLGVAGAVAGLDSIGATAADLDGLSVDQRRGLVAWVAAGGTLLVDADGADGLGALPEEWRPSASARRAAGRGQVRLTGSALREGRLDGLAEPAAGAGFGRGGDFAMGGGGVGGALQQRSGLRVLSLPVILGVLGLYVVFAGPGVRFGLRRLGRLQLTWLMVPFTALVFAGLAVAGGDLLRRGGTTTHLTVVESGTAGATSRTYLGVPTRTRTKVTSTLPVGWLAKPGLEERQARSTIRSTAAGQRVQVEGQPGGFVVIGAEGPSLVEGHLAVRLGADGGQPIVQNLLRVPLDHVALFGPGWVVALGRLEPGASAPVAAPAQGGASDPQSLAHQVWNDFGEELADPLAFASLAGLQNGPGPETGLLAAGWTDGLISPLELRTGRPSGTTLVLGRPTDGPPSGESVGTSRTGMHMTRFVVPAGRAYRLSLTPMGFGGFGGPRVVPGPGGKGFVDGEALIGGRWLPAVGDAALPEAASADGVVYIRSSLPFRPTLAAT